jgi:hypothetical protein
LGLEEGDGRFGFFAISAAHCGDDVIMVARIFLLERGVECTGSGDTPAGDPLDPKQVVDEALVHEYPLRPPPFTVRII